LLFDIGAEAFAVDRAVEHTRGGELVTAQRTNECHCPPVTMRRETGRTVTLRTPTPQRRHIGLDPSLVYEDQAARVEASLP
jgi:hypothetical protein